MAVLAAALLSALALSSAASANGGQVSAVSFTPTKAVAGATGDWTVGFTSSSSGALAGGAGFGYVLVHFPYGFTIPSPSLAGTWGSGFSCHGASAVGQNVGAQTIEVDLPTGCTLGNSTAAVLTLDGITNPGTPGSYPGAAVATSADFIPTAASAITIVAPGPPTHLAITSSTANLPSGSTRDLSAQLLDANDNVVTSDSSTSVTFSKQSGSGTVSGLGSATAASGVATRTVTGLGAGAITILAHATGLTDGTTSFTIVSVIPVNSSPPTISGTAQQGQTLTEAHGSWTNTPTGYAYQWEACDTSGSNCSAISGATNQTYVPTSGDVGHTIRVQETASNAGGSSLPAISAATLVVLQGVPVSSSPPTISGGRVESETLTEAHGSWTNTPTGFAYQWQACDSSGSNCSAISGATKQTYVPTSGDVGHTIRVQETASNAGGSSLPATSAATSVVLSVDQVCAHLIKQIKQIRKSALQIEKSYNEIVASTRKILKKVKSKATKNQVEAELTKAATLATKAKELLKKADHLTARSPSSILVPCPKTQHGDLYKKRELVAKARQDFAIARQYAAQARVIAAIAVATGG